MKTTDFVPGAIVKVVGEGTKRLFRLDKLAPCSGEHEDSEDRCAWALPVYGMDHGVQHFGKWDKSEGWRGVLLSRCTLYVAPAPRKVRTCQVKTVAA